jgi:TetR/AcrR family transcriptional regulator
LFRVPHRKQFDHTALGETLRACVAWVWLDVYSRHYTLLRPRGRVIDEGLRVTRIVAMKRPQVPARRRIGRPRASGNNASLDPAEDILQAAGRLFAERGFVGTSTEQIAAAAGLRQSAIFHWFPTKESILETLFARGWDRSLEYFRHIESRDLPAAVKLCLCLSYDAKFIAGAERHIQVMIVPPELRQPRFRRLLGKRRRLIAYFEEFIRQAIEDGDFRSLDPADAARMILAIDETVLDAARPRTARSPQRHVTTVVDFALHALVSESARIKRIQRLVAEIGKGNDSFALAGV